MLRPSNDLAAVYLCREAVDFHKGMNGLAVLVEQTLSLDPFSEQVFVFCNRNRSLVKMVVWEGNGFVLWMKRLEKARFKWPLMLNLDVVELNAQQINWLLDGYDLTLMQGHAFLPHHTVL